MQKLKTNLLYKLLIIFTIIYSFVIVKNDIFFTKYKEGNIKVEGYIEKINVDGNKASLVIKSKEKLLVSYYLESIEEKELVLEYKLGDKLIVEGQLELPNENTVFNLFNYKNYLKSQKIYFILKADKISKVGSNKNILYSFKNFIIDRIDKDDNKAYLKTFILGDKTLLDEESKNNYQENGVSHLLAISGMHISLFACILNKILSRIKKGNHHTLVCIFLLLYSFLTGFSLSVIRATSFFIFSKNGIPSLKLLIITACILLIVNPFFIYDAGFLFSYTISGYLILNAKLSNRFNNYFVKLFITSLISFTVSIPILINNFFSINILSPIWNLIFVPLVSIIIFPLSLLVLIFPFVSFLLTFFINILEFLNGFCSQFNIIFSMKAIPFIVFILYYLIITFILYKPKYSYILLIILLIHINYKNIDNNDYLTMIDVGQGDSILLELENNKNVLVDTGGITNFNTEVWKEKTKKYSISKSTIIPYLRSRGINKLDYLIITHGDFDHIGEAINLIDNFKVEKVLLNSGKNNNLEINLISHLKNKNILYQNISETDIQIGKSTLSFINPMNDNENEDSLVFLTKINNKNILFTGDAGKIAEENILNKYDLPQIDYLKVGHHGSKNSGKEEFIDKIKPKISLISAGRNNRFNHPNTETLDMLKKYNSRYYVTNEVGSILINLNNGQLKLCD